MSVCVCFLCIERRETDSSCGFFFVTLEIIRSRTFFLSSTRACNYLRFVACSGDSWWWRRWFFIVSVCFCFLLYFVFTVDYSNRFTHTLSLWHSRFLFPRRLVCSILLCCSFVFSIFLSFRFVFSRTHTLHVHSIKMRWCAVQCSRFGMYVIN